LLESLSDTESPDAAPGLGRLARNVDVTPGTLT